MDILTIQRLSKQGQGVADLEGRTVFVDGALPGEQVEARVFSEGKVLRGSVEKLLRPSPHRRVPVCPLADRRGGCDWMHLTEAEQRKAREEIVASTLSHLGGIHPGDYALQPTVCGALAIGYRRRAVMHFAKEQLGFFGKRSHQRVPVPHCPALVPLLASLPTRLSEALKSMVKDVETVTLLSEGEAFSFSVELKGQVKPRHAQAVEAAMRRVGARGAVLVPSRRGRPQIFGKPELRSPRLEQNSKGAPLYLRPDVFVQANAELNEGLVESAVNALELKEGDSVLELYAGNGNFSFALAAQAKEVVAVESSLASVDLAQRSAKEGKVSNLRFIQGDALKVARGLCDEGRRFEAMLVDPPRTGAPGLAILAAKLEIARMVYVACDPAALARDAAALKEAGFLPTSLQLVDMFPQTHHVEAVMAFERRLA